MVAAETEVTMRVTRSDALHKLCMAAEISSIYMGWLSTLIIGEVYFLGEIEKHGWTGASIA